MGVAAVVEAREVRVVESGIPLLDLATWSASGPAVDGYVRLAEAGAEGLFAATVAGDDLNKLWPPGTVCLFRKLGPEDPLPPPDSVVIVHDERLGGTSVRRLFWSEVVDAENQPQFTRVLLKPKSTNLKVPRHALEVPTEEWDRWRPYACFVGLVR